MESAAEREIGRLLLSLRHGVSGHDRAVLAGLALCVVPIPPANAVGALLTAFNLYLLARRKLPLRELWLIALCVLCLAAYAWLWAALLHLAWRHGLSLFRIPELFHMWMQQFAPGSGRGFLSV